MLNHQEPASGLLGGDAAGPYYEVAGSGHPLVLIHAGIADSRMWDDQFHILAQHFRVIRYDIRTFGKSKDQPEIFSHHQDLHELLLHLGVEKTYVMGASIGGAIAIDFTIAYPAMVDGLVLVGTGIRGYRLKHLAEQDWSELEAAYERGDYAEVVDQEVRLWVDGPGRRPDQVETSVRERVREMETANIEAGADEDAAQPLKPPAISRLREIRAPVLLIVGEEDGPDIHEVAELLKVAIPDVTVEMMPNTAHVPNMEQPEQFNALVLDFLSKRGVGWSGL